MQRYLRRLLFLLFFTLFLSPARAQQTDTYFPGTVIIKYTAEPGRTLIPPGNKATPQTRVRQVLQAAGITSSEPILPARTAAAARGSSALTASPALREAAAGMSRIHKVRYSSGIDPRQLALKLSRMPGVEYAEPLYIRRMQFDPNDPVSNIYETYHQFEEAWDISRSSEEVVIAVVDGGVNYLHPDLDDKLWVNTEEVNPALRPQVDGDGNAQITSGEVLTWLQQNEGDYNGDGSITLADALAGGSPLLTGDDTDGNGFADDLYGWDFWNAGGINGQPVQQDRNPLADGTDHGAHVAGIAAAETDNGQGVAGTGFNARYMAVKVGGIPDDPNTGDDESRSIGFGYQGIIYAALEGADVINCSWGGGSYSRFEADVIDFATAAGALVVAASGNSALNTVDFPSGYGKVLSVGSVEPSGQVASYSNIGYGIDVFATGSSIQSTGFGSDIIAKSGTSMSTPVVAGLAALLKGLHPQWSPRRIAAQIRASSTYLNASDPRQGHGAVNALRALTTELPGLRVLRADFSGPEGDKLRLGEQGTITLTLLNEGADAPNLRLFMESLAGQGISIPQPSQTVGSLAGGDSTVVTFPISVGETYDLNIVPAFRLNFTDGSQSYEDFDIFEYENILYDVMDANNITMSFAGDGTIGFTDPFEARGGVGFIPAVGDPVGNQLFEGGLMIEVEGEMYDVVRGSGGTISRDFDPLETFSVRRAGAVSAQDGQSLFRFDDAGGAEAGRVQLRTYAFDEPGLRNVVYVQYNITNPSATAPRQDMYVGLFNDWDVGADLSANSIAYSAADSILYVSGGGAPLVAVAHLGEVSSILALNNFPETTPAGPAIDIGDGFSDEEKKKALKAGRQQTAVTEADVSAVTASGPYTLNPGATVTVGFVYAYGTDLDELRAQIQAARQQPPFAVSETGVVVSDRVPETTGLFQNFPNPFSEDTIIRFDLEQAADVTLTLYDVLGRKVTVIREDRLEAGEYYIPFVPHGISSGVYYLRLRTDQRTQTIPVTYIK